MLKKLLDKTFWRFILVGLINTLVGSGAMFALYNLLGVNYWLSSAANYVVGSIVSYFLNKHFTFEVRQRDLAYVLRFVCCIGVCYLTAYGVAKPLVRRILSGASQSFQENGAMLVGMGLFTVMNYLGQRFFVFRGNAADDQEKTDEG